MTEHVQKKNPGLATLLSLLWCGLGQIYNGKIVKGLILMSIYLVCVIYFVRCILGVISGTEEEVAAKGMIAVILGIIVLMLWVYGMINAHETAEKINKTE
ncbi:MAG: hypothetical protein JSU92_03165 [Deltaproteobacteria bacterium]|nr:MAG: hypothetical protein JSU92_03165 [Deltaproteobacteria bacterium]